MVRAEEALMTDRPHRPEKAYRQEAFLNGLDGRPLRILSEYLEPFARFQRFDIEDTIVFFGSARIPSREQAEAELAEVRAKDGAESADIARAETRLEMSQYYEAARELARRFTEWSKALPGHTKRFVVSTGGGPGIMEAANRGASEARGLNLGLTISLPIEEFENPYVTRELSFEFHYFFMRKFWFTYLAKAIIVMPGGFGTLDELFETLTLIQTLKMKKRLPIVLFGTSFWDQVLNIEPLVRYGTIDASDVDLFFRTDDVDEAYRYVTAELTEHALGEPGASL
jgi:uncharacterized protein (TIGR00730 family)